MICLNTRKEVTEVAGKNSRCKPSAMRECKELQIKELKKWINKFTENVLTIILDILYILFT